MNIHSRLLMDCYTMHMWMSSVTLQIPSDAGQTREYWIRPYMGVVKITSTCSIWWTTTTTNDTQALVTSYEVLKQINTQTLPWRLPASMLLVPPAASDLLAAATHDWILKHVASVCPPSVRIKENGVNRQFRWRWVDRERESEGERGATGRDPDLD